MVGIHLPDGLAQIGVTALAMVLTLAMAPPGATAADGDPPARDV